MIFLPGDGCFVCFMRCCVFSIFCLQLFHILLPGTRNEKNVPPRIGAIEMRKTDG